MGNFMGRETAGTELTMTFSSELSLAVGGSQLIVAEFSFSSALTSISNGQVMFGGVESIEIIVDVYG